MTTPAPTPATAVHRRMTVAMQMMLTTLAVLGGLVYGLARQVPAVEPAPSGPKPVRVGPGDGIEKIQRILDQLTAGTVVEFDAGSYVGMLRLENKRGLVLRCAKNAVLTSMDGPPLEVDRSEDVRLEGFQIRFASKEARTFPALIVRNSSRIALVECTIETSAGDALVAERATKLALERCELVATAWGLQATACDGLGLTETRLRNAKQGAVYTQASSGELRGVLISGCNTGIRTVGKGSIVVTGCQLTGEDLRGIGVWVGRDSELSIEGESRIASYEKGVVVEVEGALVVGSLAISNNRFVGIQIDPGARKVKVHGVQHADQREPKLLGAEGHEIQPDLLSR